MRTYNLINVIDVDEFRNEIVNKMPIKCNARVESTTEDTLLYVEEGSEHLAESVLKDNHVRYIRMNDISNIRFYQCNADVFTTAGCVSFSWDGLESDEEVAEAWEDFFFNQNISPASTAKWLDKCTNRIYFN